jgi:hypothetical protein
MEAMQSSSPARASKVSIFASIFFVLLAMMLPACHQHPLLDNSAPDHCTICVSLHSALPMGVHAPTVAAPLLSVERVVIAGVQTQSSITPRFAASRAPPVPAC